MIGGLGNRGREAGDVVGVGGERAGGSEEIERYEGRLADRGARACMSSLTITVHEPAPILGNSPGENPLAAALRRAWKNFIAMLAGSIAALGVVVPLALLAFVGWLAYRRFKR